MIELSAVEARRVVLSAQGFGIKRRAATRSAQVLAMAQRLHAVQIDTVNVLARAHYLPIYSRLGPYPAEALDRLTNETHELVETRVGHQASFVPAELTPLLRWRHDDPSQAWRDAWRAGLDPTYVDAVEQQVVDRGPIALSDLKDPRRRTKKKPHELAIRRRDGQPYAESSLAWGRPSDGKTVLDGLLAERRLALAGRRGAERLYDLTERVLPEAVLTAPTPSPTDARRELVRLSMSALGIATVPDLANYFGLKVTDVRLAVRDLVSEGAVDEARVEGWKAPTFLYSRVTVPKHINAQSLLGPFDSLTWSRERTQRLFDFAFSFEIYVPEPKRRFGYYVLPFLLDETLRARVDLKADRQSKTLLVRGAYAEPDSEREPVARALADELHQLAGWLGLDRVHIDERGDLAGHLQRVACSDRQGSLMRPGERTSRSRSGCS
ncbi:MAG TPA: crosslink repair DNA glycosylase YcaQ family protein, partial [Acidimicrobiales bacterium]|nr:crosslink repair DNA glycosylase YcaQ family protein [Acidimicrobiales bacterium]